MNEVVAELDGDFEEGEYDFDGYLDLESDTRMREGTAGAVEGDEERTQKEDVLIGTNRDITIL